MISVSQSILHLTWCTAVQFNSHGDMSVPATRVNTNTPCCHWWIQCPCHDRSSVIVSNKVLQEKKWKKSYTVYKVISIVTIRNCVTCFCCFCVLYSVKCCSFNQLFQLHFSSGDRALICFVFSLNISFSFATISYISFGHPH